MSKYTTEVRYICETYAGYNESQGYKNIPEIIEAAREKVFDFSFDIFDPDYKPVLETKILKHYYLREIGQETVGVWKHFLDMKLNEIMPYYNKLYESAAITYDPIHDVDYYREHKGESAGQSSTQNAANGWDYYSDTPQGGVGKLEALTYLTDARHVTNSGNTSGNMSNTDEYLEHVFGKMGTTNYAKMIEEYRAALLNIDVMIIDELRDLFLNLW